MSIFNSYLVEFTKKLTNTSEEREKIEISFNYLKGKIYERFQDRLEKVEIFGSFDRFTELPQSIDVYADVDVLIIFKTNNLQPNTFLSQLKDFANKTYTRSDVNPDFPAITVQLNHIRFELIPAYWEDQIFYKELKIPAPASDKFLPILSKCKNRCHGPGY